MAITHELVSALKLFSNGRRPSSRFWIRELQHPPWGGKGSDNIPAMAAACELRWWRTGSAEAHRWVAWWREWCLRQEDPRVGHGGRETLARIYDSWTVASAISALNAPGIPEDLKVLLRQWLRRHWLLVALGAVPQSQGQHWYTGPTVTATGARSVKKRGGTSEVRGLDNEIDAMFAMAIDHPWTSKRSKKLTGPAICQSLDMGLTEFEQDVLWSLTYGELSGPDALQIFVEDLDGLVTRVPFLFCRWADGSAGTLMMDDIGVSTPPCYAVVMRGKEARPADYLVPYQAGDKYIHGEAGEAGGEWWAKAGNREDSIVLPTAKRLYAIGLDSEGIYIDESSEGPVDPPAPPPVPPPDPSPGPPADETQTPEWQLRAALRALDGGNRHMAHVHTAVAERMLKAS